jgi:hypothetical protein
MHFEVGLELVLLVELLERPPAGYRALTAIFANELDAKCAMVHVADRYQPRLIST